MRTLMNKRGKLKEMADSYTDKHGCLFMPYGPYGRIAYVIDEDGFRGPDHIAEWVVPVSFSAKAEEAFRHKLAKQNISLEDIDPFSGLAKDLVEGIPLSFGEGWHIAPSTFIMLLTEACVPDTLYYVTDDEYILDFEDMEEEIIRRDFSFQAWDDLTREEIEEWVSLFENS
jgi:hypothetical protein